MLRATCQRPRTAFADPELYRDVQASYGGRPEAAGATAECRKFLASLA